MSIIPPISTKQTKVIVCFVDIGGIIDITV
jgi:hypothetical protein